MSSDSQLTSQVAGIIRKVEKEGDRALKTFAKRFDGFDLSSLGMVLSRKKMREAYVRLPSEIKSALNLAKRRITHFHRCESRQIRRSWSVTMDGIRSGQDVKPLDTVGLYVPGGRYPYPSTVLMTAIPARVAGVRNIFLATPGKNLRDEILAGAYLCGVEKVFRIGGPAAIAAFAFGTRTVPKVQKIVGPGNQYVTEAKRQLYGRVGIDGLAGPSEVVVWADRSAKPSSVALNLLAQAEHDPQSKSILLTTNGKNAARVLMNIPAEFRRQVKVFVKSSESGVIEEINAIAPEHLYLAIRNPRRVLSRIRNAGAIFFGEKSPVALGDYVAGPSHVLPTGGSARFGSGLSVKDFLKWSSLIESVSGNSRRSFEAARILAKVEGLHYHRRSLYP